MLILLAALAAGAAALAALWILKGREISSFIDRYWTVETRSGPIQSVAFVCNGLNGPGPGFHRPVTMDER